MDKVKPTIKIEYCVGCRWLNRSSWFAQELLTTFDKELKGVMLSPSLIPGVFIIKLNEELIWDRKINDGFPDIKNLKQIIRDKVSPEKDLGHSDCG